MSSLFPYSNRLGIGYLLMPCDIDPATEVDPVITKSIIPGGCPNRMKSRPYSHAAERFDSKIAMDFAEARSNKKST
jgi:hypothetical protein